MCIVSVIFFFIYLILRLSSVHVVNTPYSMLFNHSIHGCNLSISILSIISISCPIAYYEIVQIDHVNQTKTHTQNQRSDRE